MLISECTPGAVVLVKATVYLDKWTIHRPGTPELLIGEEKPWWYDGEYVFRRLYRVEEKFLTFGTLLNKRARLYAGIEDPHAEGDRRERMLQHNFRDCVAVEMVDDKYGIHKFWAMPKDLELNRYG